jgi:hypothetical protein
MSGLAKRNAPKMHPTAKEPMMLPMSRNGIGLKLKETTRRRIVVQN